MWRRAKLMRLSVTFAGTSMLVSCLLVVAIFAGALLQRELGGIILGFFALSLVLIIASLMAFSAGPVRVPGGRCRSRYGGRGGRPECPGA